MEEVQAAGTNGDAAPSIWRMTDPINLRRVALIEGLESGGSRSVGKGEVAELQYRPNEADLRVKCFGNCFLVLGDGHFPDWHAYIDGRETQMYRTDAIVRGMFVPAGERLIRIVYRPRGLNRSFLAAGIGWCAVIGLSFFRQERSDLVVAGSSGRESFWQPAHSRNRISGQFPLMETVAPASPLLQ